LQNEIETKLGQYIDPYLGKDLQTAKVIKQVMMHADRIDIQLTFGYPIADIKEKIIANITAWLASVSQGKIINLQLSSQIETHVGKPGMYKLADMKNIIVVASGKGGVGKSTVAANIALALAKQGAQVGLLDADIYGPSQPTMMGTQGTKPIIQEKKIFPIEHHGIKTMSIGYLVDEQAPIVWRGPMIGKAMEQMLYDTQWGALDYLIVDLPPGTGDVQLTLCQKIPVSGAVIVTTPQDVALLDVKRACEMFTKLSVPILGVVENMSVYHCEQCGYASHLFGTGGGAKLAQQYGVTLLGEVPLAIAIRETTDQGVPPATGNVNKNKYTFIFYEIARKVAATLAVPLS